LLAISYALSINVGFRAYGGGHQAVLRKSRDTRSTVGYVAFVAYYFCYSSALDQESLKIWQTQHGYPEFRLPEGHLTWALDSQAVADFPSRFWGGRVLGIVAAPGQRVPGILFEITDDKDWHVIRHKEGVATGASVEIELSVLWNEQTVVARAFTTHPAKRSTEGPLSETFFPSLERAYALWKIPTQALHAAQH